MHHKEIQFAPGDVVIINGIKGKIYSISQCIEYDIIFYPEEGVRRHIYLKPEEIKDVQIIKPSFEELKYPISNIRGYLSKIENNINIKNRKKYYSLLEQISKLLQNEMGI